MADMNNLTETSVLRLGQKLRLPERSSSRTTNNVVSAGPGERIYVIQQNDSLWKIAERELGNGLRYTELAELNNLTENSVLQVGQKLRLPEK